MAETITFRPTAAARAALDEATADGSKRSVHINAAVEAYFGVATPKERAKRAERRRRTAGRDDTRSGTDRRQAARRGEPPRGAAVPPSTSECSHPREARRQLGWGARCGICGKVLK